MIAVYFCIDSDIPEEYKKIVDEIDDVDWLAFVPRFYENHPLDWLDVGKFACCSVKILDVDGGKLFVGCHS